MTCSLRIWTVLVQLATNSCFSEPHYKERDDNKITLHIHCAYINNFVSNDAISMNMVL